MLRKIQVMEKMRVTSLSIKITTPKINRVHIVQLQIEMDIKIREMATKSKPIIIQMVGGAMELRIIGIKALTKDLDRVL